MIIMSNYRIYAGDKKALVFPIMGDGYVHLDYSKHIPTGADSSSSSEGGIEVTDTVDNDDAKYGLWAHKSSFTMEGVITPYDINGFGHRLGNDYTGSGTPSIASLYGEASLELPFNKYYSPTGQLGTGSNSRTSSYFSHEKVAHLAVAINNSDTTLTVSNVEDIIGGSNIRIDNEQMEVKSVNHTIGAGKTIVVSRGQNGTTAVSHLVNAPIYGDNRINHKMVIFHNETCQFYLKNMTRTTMNQPAEYKLGCEIKGKDINGNIRTVTVESNSPVITADEEYYGKTVEQTISSNRVFGKPVFFDESDRVRYHKKIDTSDNQIYIERYYEAPIIISSSGTSALFGDLSGSNGNKIGLVGTTWDSNLAAGDYIKVIGSAKNDGHYKVKTKDSTTAITLEQAEDGTDVLIGGTHTFASDGVLAIHYQKYNFRTTFANGTSAFYTHDNASANTGNIDMSPHLWMGSSVYAKTGSAVNFGGATFSTSLEGVSATGVRAYPTYLGWISDINVTSGHKSDIVSLSKCKLVKPVRTVEEQTIYVDDARNLKINDKVWLNTEELVIESISGNSINVRRAESGAKTTALDAYSLTGATNANYIVHPNEEDNFSRTLYCALPDTGFTNGLKILDGSGDSLSNSDTYGAHYLTDTFKEASYLLRPFHMAMSYDATARRIDLFLDGKALETQTFSEGNLRMSSYTNDGAAVTINTIDNHGFSEPVTGLEYIKIENSNVTDLDGVWKITGVPSSNQLVIGTTNTVSGTLSTDTILTDVTIRTSVNISEFEFDATDCFLGSNGNTTLETRRGSQFMGEMHEFAITKEYKDQFNSIDTLVPNFRNTLVYFRFEGDDS